MKQTLAKAVLNSLGAQLAVLDTHGTIVAVNDEWKRFARENGGDDKASYVGANYLAVCESAMRQGADEVAAAALHGIRDLLRGECDSFTVEYPCHSPAEKRWFIARMTRFFHEGATYVVAVHEDITARKLAEETLRETEATLRSVLAREQLKARTDDLTGLSNRRHFFELSKQLFAVAQRYRTPFSIVMFDIDHFKQINDTLGHQAGDKILQRVARITRDHMRGADLLARYGGEEFIAAVPNAGVHEALAAADHIREIVAACRDLAGMTELSVTISAGVAEILAGEDMLDHLIQRADRALYAAKDAGRNCSRMFSSAMQAEGKNEGAQDEGAQVSRFNSATRPDAAPPHEILSTGRDQR